MASRLIEDLDPRIQSGARAVLRAWADAGFIVLVTCTYRSNEEQAALYARGRTTPGPRVTNAKPGESLHNKGLALDFVPLVNGKVMWDGDAPIWEILALIAKDTDSRVRWGGDFKSIDDKPHLQWELAPEPTFADVTTGGSTTAGDA